MKIVKMSKTVLICVSLLGLAIPCLANEIPVSGNNGRNIQQEEATVVSVDKNNVTLEAAGDKDKKLTAQFSNAAEFKAGDKVILRGNTLTKASSDTKTTPTDNKM
ncbi:MAG: hypothetical protein H7Y05_11395 [Steroidobacteraceae bacterium]|nr:hypothetical protein [Deltaproteobacteria bacterium]